MPMFWFLDAPWPLNYLNLTQSACELYLVEKEHTFYLLFVESSKVICIAAQTTAEKAHLSPYSMFKRSVKSHLEQMYQPVRSSPPVR